MIKKVLLLFAFPILAHATVIASGDNCGENCSWFIEDGVLNISGTGDIKNYERPCDGGCHSTAPWWEYSSSIQKVSIDEGIESIGYGAFANMRFTEIDLPQSLQKIGALAFIGSNLRSVDIPDSVSQIGSYAFDANYISELKLPASLIKLEAASFASNPIRVLVIPENVTDIDPLAFYCAGCSSTQAGRAMPLEAMYCSANQMSQCQNAISYFDEVNGVYEYKNIGNQFYVNGKFYNRPNDILNGNNIVKRIYTVEEAASISKKTGNTFKLKYR